MKRLFLILIFCSMCSCIQSSYLSQTVECSENDSCKTVKLITVLNFRRGTNTLHTIRYQSIYIVPIEKLNETRTIEYNKAIGYELMGVKNEND